MSTDLPAVFVETVLRRDADMRARMENGVAADKAMSDPSDGWAAIARDDGSRWRQVTPFEGRHWAALMDGRDTDGEATHVGYFNGRYWEDVEPIED